MRDGVVAATTSSGEDEAAMLENWVAGNGELLAGCMSSNSNLHSLHNNK